MSWDAKLHATFARLAGHSGRHAGVIVSDGLVRRLVVRAGAGKPLPERETVEPAPLAGAKARVARESATLVLPHGRVHSQRILVDEGTASAVEALAREFAGAGDARSVVHGSSRFHRVAPGTGGDEHLWVSLAREEESVRLCERSGEPGESTANVIGVDTALAMAHRTACGDVSHAILLDLGNDAAQAVVLIGGEPRCSADLEPGGNALLAALASDLGGSVSDARAFLAKSAPLDPAKFPRFRSALARLAQGLESVLREHAREEGLAPKDLLAAPIWLGGIVASTPVGVAAFGSVLGAERVREWPVLTGVGGESWALGPRAVAYGAAVAGLAAADSLANLAAPTVRRERAAWLRASAFQVCGAVLAVVALGLGTVRVIRSASEASERRAVVAALEQAQAVVPALQQARTEREDAYIAALPALYLQKRTRDFVSGLRLLQEKGRSGDHWLALVADQETYQAGSLPQGTPASAPEPQILRGMVNRVSGLVIELGFKPNTADPLAEVSTMIAEMKSSGAFREVDLLPARERQTLADRTVFAEKGAEFALRLEARPFAHHLPPAAELTRAGGLFGAP